VSPLLPIRETYKKHSFLAELLHKGENELLADLKNEFSRLMLEEYVRFLNIYEDIFDVIIFWDGTFETAVDEDLCNLFDHVIDIDTGDDCEKYIVSRDLSHPVLKHFNRHPNNRYFNELLCPAIVKIIKSVCTD
jgi:hypothetical protein